MDVEMGTTDEEAAATDDVEVSVAIAPVLEVELAEAFSWAVTTPREATTARSKVDLLNILMGVCVFVWL